MNATTKCFECGNTVEDVRANYRCPKCKGLLDVSYDMDLVRSTLKEGEWMKAPTSVWRYRYLLPVGDRSKVVTLGEGGTKLHSCHRMGETIGIDALYAKNEGENPTGSFKDRGMTVGITKAIEFGVGAVICASTGNTSASMAAYSAKAGIRCIVVAPGRGVAAGKLAQAIAYGARILKVSGNFDEALRLVLRVVEERKDVYLLNSVNPFRLEGQKTIAYEICEQLGEVPDNLILPVGNAGNISAIWKGFKEFRELGFIDKLPVMIGVQAEGAAPLARAVAEGKQEIQPVKDPKTLASAIRIGSPANWRKALRAVQESSGSMISVTDEEIIEAQKQLARLESLFVEPASAAPVAGLKKLVKEGFVTKGDKVVCVVTGNGLKDPRVVEEFYEKPVEVEAEYQAFLKALGI